MCVCVCCQLRLTVRGLQIEGSDIKEGHVDLSAHVDHSQLVRMYNSASQLVEDTLYCGSELMKPEEVSFDGMCLRVCVCVSVRACV